MKENEQLITEEELFDWTDYKSRGSLISWLQKNNIAFHTGKGGRVCTTLAAINKSGSVNDDEIRFA